MRSISTLLFLSLLWMGCQLKHPKFFNYDEVIHYHNPIDDSAIDAVFDARSGSAMDALKKAVLTDDFPKTINDTAFIYQLNKIGYQEKILDRSLFGELDQIFAEKQVISPEATSCIYVYRDILVFRKQGKVIGIAKVCLGCMAHIIRGAHGNTDNFGQDGDYLRLYRLLHGQEH